MGSWATGLSKFSETASFNNCILCLLVLPLTFKMLRFSEKQKCEKHAKIGSEEHFFSHQCKLKTDWKQMNERRSNWHINSRWAKHLIQTYFFPPQSKMKISTAVEKPAEVQQPQKQQTQGMCRKIKVALSGSDWRMQKVCFSLYTMKNIPRLIILSQKNWLPSRPFASPQFISFLRTSETTK